MSYILHKTRPARISGSRLVQALVLGTPSFLCECCQSNKVSVKITPAYHTIASYITRD